MWEGTIVEIINHALALGKTPDDPEWPLASLAHWNRDSTASSGAGEADMRVCGLVDLRLELRTTNGGRSLHVFRFRIMRGGFDKPPFLLIGAPALDAPPLGIGHRPLLGGHYFPGLGITVARKEADAVQAKLLTVSCIFPAVRSEIFSAVGETLWTSGSCSQ